MNAGGISVENVSEEPGLSPPYKQGLDRKRTIPLLRSLYEPGVASTNAGYRIKWLKIAATASVTITSFSAKARRRFGSSTLTTTYNAAATTQMIKL